MRPINHALCVGLAVLALPLPGGPPAPAALQAPASSPVPALEAALSRVSRYAFALSARTSPVGMGQAAALEQITDVVVRVGATTDEHLTIRITGHPNGRTVSQYLEAVIHGHHTCQRATPTGRYTCATAASPPHDDLAPNFRALETTPFIRTGATVIQGRHCDGYAYVPRLPGARARATLYVERRTHLPCAVDERVTGTGPGSGLTITSHIVTTWGRFDDPRLAVPPDPAA